jgi:hypothetical protein
MLQLLNPDFSSRSSECGTLIFRRCLLLGVPETRPEHSPRKPVLNISTWGLGFKNHCSNPCSIFSWQAMQCFAHGTASSRFCCNSS